MPPSFAGAPDQVEVLVAHPDDQTAVIKIGPRTGAYLVVHFKPQPGTRMADLPVLLPWIARHAKTIAAASCQRDHAMGARRVKPHQHAQRLQNRGFPLCVVTHKHAAALRHLKGQRIKTAEIHQPE